MARSGSASLGECDVLPYLDGAMKVDDAALAQAVAQGQTFFASTGDTGSSCAVAGTNGVPLSGPPDTEYPASSPYAVAVGGTTLDTDNSDNYQAEIAWNAGGGGISPVETAPKWQSGVVPTSAAGLRGVPDIALDADPNTGAQIYVSGVKTQIGGTSLSSPMALGFWTRLQASHGNKLGFAAPRLYKLYQGATTGTTPGFHDVLLGGNGTYLATPGWDYTTGLGSFDLNALARRSADRSQDGLVGDDRVEHVALGHAELLGDRSDRVLTWLTGCLAIRDRRGEFVRRAGRDGLDGPRHHERDLAAHLTLGPRCKFGERPAADLLIGLRELAAHGGCTVGAECLDQIGQRLAEAVRRLEEHHRARLACQRRQRASPLAGAARQEALEAEPVDRQPGDRDRGRDRGRPGKCGHVDAFGDGGGNESIARVRHRRHAGIADHQHVLAAAQRFDQRGTRAVSFPRRTTRCVRTG